MTNCEVPVTEASTVRQSPQAGDSVVAPPLQARAARTRDSIELAALEAFSRMGFEAASTRAIADAAGVKQQLITYHYETKLRLWKAVADRLFAEIRGRFEQRLAGLEGVDEATQVRLLVREYIMFCAERPELARFMMHEGSHPGSRLTWLYERHTKTLMAAMRERIAWAQAEGLAPAGDPGQLMFVLMGASGMFSQGAEYALVTGQRATDPDVVARYVDLILTLLLPGA